VSGRTIANRAPWVRAFSAQMRGRGTPDDLSKITQPTLIANGDNDRMVPSTLSEDLHRRIEGSELIIYPDSGHGGIFQFHDKFVPVVVEFLDR
jgi:pimeloyl-ACP methyl ester carboxylesterase